MLRKINMSSVDRLTCTTLSIGYALIKSHISIYKLVIAVTRSVEMPKMYSKFVLNALSVVVIW